MSKALMGYVGQPPAYMILRELNALKARVAELERFLHQGPRWAEVQSLDSQRVPATGEFHRFEAR